MARAGYCSACGRNCYVNADGSCASGHAATYISNVYEVPDAVPAHAAPVVGYAAPETCEPPKKKRTGLVVALVIVALLLLCGCGIGGFLLFAASSSDSDDAKPTASASALAAEDKAKLEAGLSLVKSMAKGDAELMKSVMPAATVSAMPADFWASFASTAASGASVLGKETWDSDSLTIDTQSNQGPGTITLRISDTDPLAIAVRSVKGDASTTDSTIKLGDEGGTWKVLALTSGENTIPFDAEGLKAFLEANQ